MQDGPGAFSVRRMHMHAAYEYRPLVPPITAG